MVTPLDAAACLCLQELFGEIEGGVEQTSSDTLAEWARKGFGFGNEPCHEIKDACEDDEVFHVFSRVA